MLRTLARTMTFCAICAVSIPGFGWADTSSNAQTLAIQKLLDIEEIKGLHLSYAAFNETKNVDGLVDLFTDDAVLSFGSHYGGDWSGKETIRKNYTHWINEVGDQFDALYVLTNPQIVLTSPTTAYGRWTFTNYLTRQVAGSELTTVGGEKQPLYILGMYEDEYRKVDGKWKISRLKLTVFWPERNFTGLAHP